MEQDDINCLTGLFVSDILPGNIRIPLDMTLNIKLIIVPVGYNGLKEQGFVYIVQIAGFGEKKTKNGRNI